nr:MAG TPA: hypothetical protein [Caudoviricetes sp.]DAW98166.1 MAG TPA: hypothetical protein [Bacteriophage sp.]DAX07454.1 MAG TPA: hypothetical protein [Bacteriophage sp.]
MKFCSKTLPIFFAIIIHSFLIKGRQSSHLP